MRRAALVAVTIAFAVLLGGMAPSTAKYELKRKYVLGGEGGWDYLTYDPVGKRLFISRGTRVMVVDPEKGTVIGEVADTPGVHGIALAQDLGKGFTSNGRDNSVTVFDLKSLQQTARIKLPGENPDAILYDSASKRIFTFNGRSKNATVIDAAKGEVIGSIPLTGKPEFAAADGKGTVFVNIEDTAELTAINARQARVLHTWPMKPCEEPTGLSMDRKRRRLFAGCHNKLLTVLNADNGKVVATVPIGEGVDATDFDPATQLVFTSNGDGTLTVVHEDASDKFTVVDNAATLRSARTMAMNPAQREIYLVAAEFEETPPAKEGERPRRTMKPGTFTLLVMESTTPVASAQPPKTAPAKPVAVTTTSVPDTTPAASAQPAKTAPAKPVAATTASAPDTTGAAALYKSKCQICHGADGKGSAVGQKMGVKDFHSPEVAGQSDAELLEVVKKGKGKMQGYAGKLPDDQLKGLIAFIRTLK